MKNEQLIIYLGTFGLRVVSYNPGGKKLYQVGIPMEHGAYKPVSGYMGNKEFSAWVAGFSDALELKKRKIIW